MEEGKLIEERGLLQDPPGTGAHSHVQELGGKKLPKLISLENETGLIQKPFSCTLIGGAFCCYAALGGLHLRPVGPHPGSRDGIEDSYWR